MPVRATQYLLPEGIGLDAAVAQLAARFDIAGGPAEPTDRTFYDTFDGRLRAAGLAVIAEGGRLVVATGATYQELAATSAAAPAERIFAGELGDGRVRGLIEPIIAVRALLPIARIRGRARGVRVRNRDEKTVVRIELQAAEAVSGSPGGLRSRVHVIGVRGYDRALDRVRRKLEGELGLEASESPLHDDAVRAAGGRPGGVSTKLDLRLEAREPAAAGAALAMGAMLETIHLTLPGTVDDVDSEFLHDLRVAVRRTRSVQRQLARVFPAGRLRWFRDEFRWLGQVTGPTRDLDVLLDDFARMRSELPAGRAAELEPVGGLLRERRAGEWALMVEGLASDRTGILLRDWADFLAGVRAEPDRAAAAGRLGEVVGGRIRSVYREMRRAGSAINEQTAAGELHDLRKLGKELRYLLEIFADLYPAAAVKPTVRTLKALQETLGQFQDREVQAGMLRALGEEVAGEAGGPAALIALGVVLERVEADSVAARGEFTERFAVFAAADQRTVVREAFR
jgi:CHAD domain-containing protein